MSAPSVAASSDSSQHNREAADILLAASLQQHDTFTQQQHATHTAVTTALAVAKWVIAVTTALSVAKWVIAVTTAVAIAKWVIAVTIALDVA